MRMRLLEVGLCGISVFLTGFAMGASDLRADADRTQTTHLVVHLSLAKKRFLTGETIPFKVVISNDGETPIVIGSYISLNGSDPVAHVEFNLKDSTGRAYSRAVYGEGMTPPEVKLNPAAAVLGSWMVLWPGSSLSSTIALDRDADIALPALGSPGVFTLSVTYYSPGFSYPLSYEPAGLTEDDLKALPYTYFSGRAESNAVTFELVAAAHSPARHAQ